MKNVWQILRPLVRAFPRLSILIRGLEHRTPKKVNHRHNLNVLADKSFRLLVMLQSED